MPSSNRPERLLSTTTLFEPDRTNPPFQCPVTVLPAMCARLPVSFSAGSLSS
jgi:hypothetical protein